LAAPGLSLIMRDTIFQDALIMKELFFSVYLLFSYYHNFQAVIFKFNPGTGFAYSIFTAVTMKAGDKTVLGEREKIK
jgi:ascorbate-specific PTS system EIIC-type component UlaA